MKLSLITILILLLIIIIIVYTSDQDHHQDHRQHHQHHQHHQDQDQYKNCLSRNAWHTLNNNPVPVGTDCPNNTVTCQYYSGCDNDNIPMCRNQNNNYDLSCPVCENGEWKCDFFSMGYRGVINGPGGGNTSVNPDNGWTYDNECVGASDTYSCEYNKCLSNEECNWGEFTSNGPYKYGDAGSKDPTKVTGYKIVTSLHPTFKLNHKYDGSGTLAGAVRSYTVNNLSECINKGKKSYTYNGVLYDGSYGFVYDTDNKTCNLHQIGEDVFTDQMSKFVKG